MFPKFLSLAIKVDKLFKRLHKVNYTRVTIEWRSFCPDLHKDVMSVGGGGVS